MISYVASIPCRRLCPGVGNVIKVLAFHFRFRDPVYNPWSNLLVDLIWEWSVVYHLGTLFILWEPHWGSPTENYVEDILQWGLVICTQVWGRALNQENLILTVLIYSLFWLTKRNTYIFYIREISIIFLSAMKIDFDVITLRGCLMCFWQYKMDRNDGWCWIEDTVVSWTLSQTENGKIKAHTINVLSIRVSLRKNGGYDILMLKIAKDSKSFHHLLFTVITDIIRWKQP